MNFPLSTYSAFEEKNVSERKRKYFLRAPTAGFLQGPRSDCQGVKSSRTDAASSTAGEGVGALSVFVAFHHQKDAGKKF